RSPDRWTARCLEGSGGFVASTDAPIATGWSHPSAGGNRTPGDPRLITAHIHTNHLDTNYPRGTLKSGPRAGASSTTNGVVPTPGLDRVAAAHLNGRQAPGRP